jgi:hypothetical protein
MNKRKTAMPFAIPGIWCEPKNHVDDCYFCCVSVTGFSAKNKDKIMYPNLNSAMRPILHDDNLPVKEPPENGLAFSEWNVKMVLHLKPFSTLQMINTFQRRGIQNQNDLISRN